MEFKERMRAARAKANLQPAAAAEKAGVSLSYWQKLEVGQMENPSFSIMSRIAGACGMTVTEFLMLEKSAEKVA